MNTFEPEQNEKTAEVIKKAEKRLRIGFTTSSRRNRPRHKSSQCDYSHRKTTTGKYLQPLSISPNTPLHMIRTATLQR